MDNILLSIANDYTNKVALGFSDVQIDDTTGTVTIKLKDGSSASWIFPKPANGKDGLGIKNVNVEIVTVDDKQEYHLFVTYSDDSTYDAGKFPEQIINISKEEGNALTKKPDGLYVAKGAVEISQKEGNIIKSEADGLYAKTDTIKISKGEKNILKQNEDGLYVPETDLSSYAKKSDLTSVYKYKGSVAKKIDLPTDDLTVGDVYNIEDTGMNVAWTGTAWDDLGTSVDLSAYAKSADVVAKNQTEANKGKFLGIGNDGNVVPTDIPTPDLSEYAKSDYVLADANTDLNNLKSNGRYFFLHNRTYSNLPPNTVNGWLDVKFSKSVPSVVKQIFYRQGSNGINDFEIYVRTFSTSWSEWTKLLTEKQSTHTITYTATNGTTKTITIFGK